MGATPASIANAASEWIRPGWDHAHKTVAATIGPTPNSSSSSGRQLRMMATIAFCSSRASFSIACARRAKVRNATTVLVVSTSHDERTRRLAAVLSMAASFWARNRARMGSGAAMTRLKTCCWASVEALIAERRAAKSTDRASRGPLRAVQLDDDLGHLQQVTAQASAVTTGALDRPGPQRCLVVGELHQIGIALGCRIDGDLVEDTTGRGVEDRCGVGMDVGVDADDDIDHFA